MFDSINKDRLLLILCASCVRKPWFNVYSVMMDACGESDEERAETAQRTMMVLSKGTRPTEENIRAFFARMRRSGFRHRSKQRCSPFHYRPEDNSLVEPGESKATKNNIWLFVFHWGGRDHWVGIPRETAKRALALGHLPVAP